MDFLKNSKRFSFRLGEKDALGNVCETETVRDGDTLTTVYRFEGGLTVTNIARKHGKCAGGDVGADAYEWVNLFENTGNEPTEIISELWDCDVEIPFEKDAPKGWTAYIPDKEKVMKIYAPSGSTWTGYEFFANPDESVQGFYPYYLFPDHAHKSYSTCGGRSSNSRAPFFNIHRQGAGVIFAIGWTGQWICDIDRTETGVRIRTKIEDTHFRLLPGEKIRTSSVVIMPYNGTVTESQNMWRRLVRRDFSLIGKPGRDAEGIFCAGIWGGMSDEGVLSRINKIRENKLPFEDIWMDAGWYGTDPTPSPDEFEGRWYDHTGDWRVNAHHHPNGLEPISKAVRDAGMKYLLWVEPERVIRSTPIAKEHPEYFLTSPNAECTSLLLNLGDEEAWNYCFNTLSELIERLNLHYYRQDFNTEPLELLAAKTEQRGQSRNQRDQIHFWIVPPLGRSAREISAPHDRQLLKRRQKNRHRNLKTFRSSLEKRRTVSGKLSVRDCADAQYGVLGVDTVQRHGHRQGTRGHVQSKKRIQRCAHHELLFLGKRELLRKRKRNRVASQNRRGISQGTPVFLWGHLPLNADKRPNGYLVCGAV